ncbi:MAG TPA: sigma-70 family RNA polymerase sigma factor [Myxococcaceae bacterium]|nr:sigma-70 family RNA polymerase sigma factor [Myxococcaceae bacterium]
MPADDLEQQIAALHPASFAWALACTRWNATEAEEVLQAVYLSILEGRARFDGRSTFKTWLFSVVRNMAARARRRHWLEARAPWRAFLGGAPEPGPHEAVASEQHGAQVRRALGTLPARQREVLDLVFFHEMSVEQAAQVMDVSPGTARTHYHRGKLRLLELLGPEDPR